MCFVYQTDNISWHDSSNCFGWHFDGRIKRAKFFVFKNGQIFWKSKSEQKKADWQYIIFLNEAVTQYMLR